MILFFDRSLGTGIPRAMKRIRRFPCPVEMHDSYFGPTTEDDEWLPEVAKRGWTVISQDYKLHVRENELHALKTNGVGAFYLWGASEPQW